MGEKLYEEIMNSADLDYLIETNKKHSSGIADAIKSLEIDPKKIKNIEEGIESMTDSLIKYKESIGESVDEKERHRYFSEVKSFIEAYKEQNKVSDSEIMKMFRQGDGYTLLTSFLENKKISEMESKKRHVLSKYITSDLSPEKARGLAEIYLRKQDGFAEPTDGDISRLADVEALKKVFSNAYQKILDGKAKNYIPEKQYRDAA